MYYHTAIDDPFDGERTVCRKQPRWAPSNPPSPILIRSISELWQPLLRVLSIQKRQDVPTLEPLAEKGGKCMLDDIWEFSAEMEDEIGDAVAQAVRAAQVCSAICIHKEIERMYHTANVGR